MITEKLEKLLKMLPAAPGVYIMKNAAGNVIYIGKSRSLKNRVRSYFNRKHDSLKTSVLVSAIEDIEYIVTRTEVEALILENTLIKKHKPRYNIMLKDSKTHPYIRVTMSEDFPRLEKVRKVVFRDRNLYFGPFPNEYDLQRIVEMLSRNFRLCTHRGMRIIAGKKKRACLKYHLGVCQGVCEGDVSSEEYRLAVAKAVDVLSGRVPPDFSALEEQLKFLSARFRFEEAAEIRDTITALKRFFEKQKVEFLKPVDADIWGCAEAQERIIFSVFFVRAGKLTGNRIIDVLREPDSHSDEILRKVMMQLYDANILPPNIYCGFFPESIQLLQEHFTARAGKKTLINVPRKGQFLQLLEMADQNAMEVLRNLKSDIDEKIDEAVIDLQNRLQLPRIPVRIECVDISHIQGTDPVASLVVSRNGKPRKGEYRLYHIKTARGGDDPASIAEVTRRRFARLVEEGNSFPDLYVVDGGITQVRAAVKELDLLGINVAVLGLAKREETLVDKDNNEFSLPLGCPGLRIIVKLRNEAHRFANSFQKKTHSRKTLRSSLLNLPGVGPVTLKKALWEFGSVANIARATPEELSSRCRMPIKIARIIILSLKDGADDC